MPAASGFKTGKATFLLLICFRDIDPPRLCVTGTDGPSREIEYSPKRDRFGRLSAASRRHCFDHATRGHTGETGSSEHHCIAGLLTRRFRSPALSTLLLPVSVPAAPTFVGGYDRSYRPDTGKRAERRLRGQERSGVSEDAPFCFRASGLAASDKSIQGMRPFRIGSFFSSAGNCVLVRQLRGPHFRT